MNTKYIKDGEEQQDMNNDLPWFAAHSLLEVIAGGGSRAANMGYWTMTKDWSKRRAVAGVTGILWEWDRVSGCEKEGIWERVSVWEIGRASCRERVSSPV